MDDFYWIDDGDYLGNDEIDSYDYDDDSDEDYLEELDHYELESVNENLIIDEDFESDFDSGSSINSDSMS